MKKILTFFENINKFVERIFSLLLAITVIIVS